VVGAILLAALGLTAACGSSKPDGSSPTASSTAATTPSWVGHTWLLAKAVTPKGTTIVPASYAGTCEFTSSGELHAHDGVNSMSGTFTLTSKGFAPHDVMSTLMGYPGHDPVVISVVDAITAITTDEVTANARPDGLSLVLTKPGYELTFTRIG
jgi:heat shock protein HslJ